MGFIEKIGGHNKLHKVTKDMTWQDFERLVSEVFLEHGYRVDTNSVYTDKGRRAQFDVLAEKGDTVIAVDCKHWDKNRHRVSAIKKAVDGHVKRCNFLEQLIRLKVKPVIVTLYEEDVKFHNDVPIVPVSMVNDFILNFL